MNLAVQLGHALRMSFVMAWEIFRGLSIGFFFSTIVDEIISRDEMSRLLPDDKPRSIMIAAALGAVSSSCSYAAVAMARSMVRKGANFTAAIAFQLAATNLVLELDVLFVVLLGRQFGLAEFMGGPIMIVLLVPVFRLVLRPDVVQKAVEQADRNVAEGLTARYSTSIENTTGEE
jgi:uncharacterized membrane protein YraQ (UPF0718 family)